MNVVLGYDSALQGYTGPGTPWADKMNFVNRTSGAGSIDRPVDQQSNALPLYLGRHLKHANNVSSSSKSVYQQTNCNLLFTIIIGAIPQVVSGLV